MKTFDLRHNWIQNSDTRRWECECLLSGSIPYDGFCANKIRRLSDALAPLVTVADTYDAGNLEEARPEWVAHGTQKLDECQLAATRGGRILLTVADVLRVRAALRGEGVESSRHE